MKSDLELIGEISESPAKRERIEAIEELGKHVETHMACVDGPACAWSLSIAGWFRRAKKRHIPVTWIWTAVGCGEVFEIMSKKVKDVVEEAEEARMEH